MLKKNFYRFFTQGLWTIAPLTLTFVVILWVFYFLENVFKVPLIYCVGENYYFPGLGIITALIIITFIGMIINNWLIRQLYCLGDSLIRKIPLIKTVYNAVSTAISFFDSDSQQNLNHVVLVDVNGFRIFGFVTRETFDDLPQISGNDQVAVYIPFSYQIGGYTFIVSKSRIMQIDIPVEEAMRFSLTAGLIKKQNEDKMASSKVDKPQPK